MDKKGASADKRMARCAIIPQTSKPRNERRARTVRGLRIPGRVRSRLARD